MQITSKSRVLVDIEPRIDFELSNSPNFPITKADFDLQQESLVGDIEETISNISDSNFVSLAVYRYNPVVIQATMWLYSKANWKIEYITDEEYLRNNYIVLE